MPRDKESLRVRLHTSDAAVKLSMGFVRLISLPLRPRSRPYVRALLAERLPPILETHGISFYCPGYHPFNRHAEFARKEPDTLAWIDAMAVDSVLWDVGANVGVYTLYAASRGLHVCAFEPEAGSFFVLQKNLDLNGLHDRVTALNMGLAEKTGISNFHVARPGIGAARHGFTANPGRRVQAYAGRDLPGLGLPAPNYMKIDVD